LRFSFIPPELLLGACDLRAEGADFDAMPRLAFILALLFAAPWQEAEIVDVENFGAVDLKPFICQDITRSSVLSRVCYDTQSRRMLVQRHAVYRQYCDLPKAKVDALLNAPSMGQFFKATIEGSDGGGPYACPPQG
jgi:KTSC domain